MNSQQYHQLLRFTINSILQGHSALYVESDGPQPDVYFNLPSAQTSGTMTQRISADKQSAREFLSNHGITEPSIF